ncbi:14828_t:CDS:2, partial [Funneliformis geosporum]
VNFNEGLNVLSSYLQERNNKLYRNFLLQNRDTVVTSSLLFSKNWEVLDNTCATNFLREAGKLKLDLREKVRSRDAKDLESYWEGVLQECNL